jgi:hypothetical protein
VTKVKVSLRAIFFIGGSIGFETSPLVLGMGLAQEGWGIRGLIGCQNGGQKLQYTEKKNDDHLETTIAMARNHSMPNREKS